MRAEATEAQGRAETGSRTQASGPRREYVDETPRRPRRSPIETRAEDELGHHWVTVLSIERPVPRRFGDNVGMLPIWVESNADWRRSGVVFDANQPAVRTVRLAVLGVPSVEHAGRLKAALDEALAGRAADSDADPLRHRFRNGVDLGSIEEWWPPLAADALMQCELAATDFEVFDRVEHERKVTARVRFLEEQAMTGRGR